MEALRQPIVRPIASAHHRRDGASREIRHHPFPGPWMTRILPLRPWSKRCRNNLAWKLEKKKVQIDVLTVDHVEKAPTEN